MRTSWTKKVTGYVAIASLVIGPFVSPVSHARPLQGVLTATPKSATESGVKAGAEPGKLTKNPVLARNTAVKPEPNSTAVPAKEQKTHDKKTIGRCWKRLMNMVREVNHAHRKKAK